MGRNDFGREFRVDVAALKRQPGSRRDLVFDGVIDDLSVSGSHIDAGEPVHVAVTLESASGGIFVTGQVTAQWRGECRRCLEPAVGNLRAEISELCEPNPADEELTYSLGRDELDLLPIVHDACILELPLVPLCQEDCLGLCPTCGMNRNLEACACEPARDSPFVGLSLALGGDSEEASASRTTRKT